MMAMGLLEAGLVMLMVHSLQRAILLVVGLILLMLLLFIRKMVVLSVPPSRP
jgi:hypothetical protein